MTDTRPARGDDARERVLRATCTLVLSDGLRRLRTADIAKAAGTTESTMYRHFSSLDEILALAYDRAWTIVNTTIARASFEDPGAGNPVTTLLSDTAALWDMRGRPDEAEAAQLALMFAHRSTELAPPGLVANPEHHRFDRRLARLCAAITHGPNPGTSSQTAENLKGLIAAYASAMWMTWNVADGAIADAAPSNEEAQLGVMVLVDRFSAGADTKEVRG